MLSGPLCSPPLPWGSQKQGGPLYSFLSSLQQDLRCTQMVPCLSPGFTTQLHIQSPVQALHNHQQSNLLERCSFVQIPDQVTQERALPGCLKRMLGAAHTFLRHARSWDVKQLHSHPQREACLSACSAPNTGSSVSQNEGHQKIIDFT